MQELDDLERAKRRCRTFIDGKPIYEVLPSMYRDMSSGEISRCTGIPRDTVSVWARRLSLEHSKETLLRIKSVRSGNAEKGRPLRRKKLYQGMTIPEIVKQYFPILSSREIADKFGCSDSFVRTVAREMGIKHNRETQKRIIAFRVSRRSYHPMTEEEKAEWVEKRKKLYKLERWKQENGIERRTKLRISPLTKKQKNAKQLLCAKRHYFSDCSIDPFAVFYDEQTKRFSPTYRRDEEYYAKNLGLHFLPADGYEEDDV